MSTAQKPNAALPHTHTHTHLGGGVQLFWVLDKVGNLGHVPVLVEHLLQVLAGWLIVARKHRVTEPPGTAVLVLAEGHRTRQDVGVHRPLGGNRHEAVLILQHADTNALH